jgi:phenylalanyl-tRNA synthetase alpha chain
MKLYFTEVQKQRLKELDGGMDHLIQSFSDEQTRDDLFKQMESQLVRKNKQILKNRLESGHLPVLQHLQNKMSSWLIDEEKFSRVSTPAIISREMLKKMTITQDHPLTSQVFWVDKNKCLRPMLAPNLYIMMKEMNKMTKTPIRIFECGSCFRKESQGAQHLNEFTMLNLVEYGGFENGGQVERLEYLAKRAMEILEIDTYKLVVEKSEVYQTTIDIEIDGMEVASCSYGPHPLDHQWGVFDAWVGLGFGLERIAMIKGQTTNIKRIGRGLTYYDGIRLST